MGCDGDLIGLESRMCVLLDDRDFGHASLNLFLTSSKDCALILQPHYDASVLLRG